MSDTARDPVDHQRAGRPLGNGSMKNSARTPGAVFVAMAVIAFVVCLAGFAGRHVGLGIGATIVTLLTAGAALAWLTMEGRRFRQIEHDWSRTHHGAA